MKKLQVIFVYLLMLGACRTPTPTALLPSPTIAATTSIPSLTPVLPVIIPTSTPSFGNEFLKLSALEPGLFIAFVEYSSDKIYLSAASFDGDYQGRLAESVGGYGFAISPDKKLLADLPYILNLESETREYYADLENCTHPNWSPDSTKLAISCPTNDYHHDDIYIFSMRDQKKIPVTNCEHEAFSCGSPLWSPDNRWLASYRGLGGAGTSQLTGLHILDTTCPSGLDNCWYDEKGVDASPSFSWSPNGQLLATVDNGKVSVYQIKNSRLILSESYEIDMVLDWVTWLDNNNELLVLEYSDKGGFIISRETGLMSSLTKAQLEFFQSQIHDSMFVFVIP